MTYEDEAVVFCLSQLVLPKAANKSFNLVPVNCMSYKTV